MPGKSVALVVSVPILVIAGCTIGDARDFVELDGPGFSEQDFDFGSKQKGPVGPAGLSQDAADEMTETEAQSLGNTDDYHFIPCPDHFTTKAVVEAEGAWGWGFEVYPAAVNTVKASPLEDGGWSLSCIASGSRLEVSFEGGDSSPGQNSVGVSEVGVRQVVSYESCFTVPDALGFLCTGTVIVSSGESTFADEILPILQDECGTCHSDSSPNSTIIPFNVAPEAAYQAMVQAGLLDIANPSSSPLLTVPSEGTTEGHPVAWSTGGNAYQAVLAWIESGAPAP